MSSKAVIPTLPKLACDVLKDRSPGLMLFRINRAHCWDARTGTEILGKTQMARIEDLYRVVGCYLHG